MFRCVTAIANSIASIDFLPYVKKRGGGYAVDEKHPFLDLLNNPNPYMSGYGLRQYTGAALALTGNAYWALERLGTRDIQEVWPLIPDTVRPVTSKTKMIDHYLVRVGATQVRFEYDEMIHFRDFNPQSFVYGQGALSAARTTVATDIFAQVWNKAYFENSARPDGTLETDKVLADEVRRRVRKAWSEMHQGARKHGKTAILEGGLKYNAISDNAKDMDFVNLRKDQRLEILAAFGVPPSIVGLLEYANYSNMAQQDKNFWQTTLLPQLRNISDTLTMRVKQLTFRSAVEFQADTSKVKALQADMKEKAETMERFVLSGVPPNAVIDALDLPFDHFEGGDVSRQTGTVGAPSPSPAPSPVGNPAPDPQNPPKRAKAAIVDRESRRAAIWKRLDERVSRREGEMHTSMRGFFAGQKRRVIKKLNEHARRVIQSAKNFRSTDAGHKNVDDSVRIIFDYDQENEAMSRPAKRTISGTYFDFLVSTGRAINPDFDFSLTDPYATAWINQKVTKLVREANAYTMEQLTQEIVDAVHEAVAAGFEESETIAQIVDRIDSVYQFANETRADRIARTEVNGAANAGSLEGLKKTGSDTKEWLSSRDEKVRETHQGLDANVVGIDENFISPSGASLKFPGDSEAPVEEIVNCRCRVISQGSVE